MPIAHSAPLSGHRYSAIELVEDRDACLMLDQRELPVQERYHRYETVDEIAEAIRAMVIRGAPAIGIAAAYGLALAARSPRGRSDFAGEIARASTLLAATRPTAVNLFWAIARVGKQCALWADLSHAERSERVADEALEIHREDVRACRAMGALGAAWMPDDGVVLTHCNAGALATGGYGTALGVIRAAIAQGKRVRVLADETRPYLQGARLTAWELRHDDIPVEVITDSMAAHFFQRGEIRAVVVGSDRVAANGDVANKIGTYGVACLAHMHRCPLVVAAPWSTVDLQCANGEQIPIEERASREVTHLGDAQLVPYGVRARHPGFDVTPARLVTALVTERGIASPVTAQSVGALAG
ncbi:MAG: S-methyl-5-thioribose-1-phosphate isomerase [Deltaproteobacteria bacterium]|nr:S-methyl-5-thioribose-1-phosphate isomerase [Deltaproteobacteria bacterium]